ncbi:MAG: hypothetical protein ABWZ25_19425 [Chitinophagaceae bacterium]
MPVDSRRWRLVMLTCFLLLIATAILSGILYSNPIFIQKGSNISLNGFVHKFLDDPIWVLKFYFIAISGVFLGEAQNMLDLRALFGVGMLIVFGLSIWYVIRRRNKTLVIPMAMIFYNLLCCLLITMSRYIYDSIGYGASSRYTAYNMFGAIGVTTILFFFIWDNRQRIAQFAGGTLLLCIVTSYIMLDLKQIKISPYRTAAFEQIRNSLLTGTNLSVLQNDSATSLRAIKVLAKYQLSVYRNIRPPEEINLDGPGFITFKAGEFSSGGLTTSGFYDYETDNKFRWTSGSSSILLKNPVKVTGPILVRLSTYMPPACANITPQIILRDQLMKNHETSMVKREGDIFTYSVPIEGTSVISSLGIYADTIPTSGDQRRLSFPFIELTISKK